MRWSRPVTWTERAIQVPQKLKALLWGLGGITVINVTLALFTGYNQYETERQQNQMVWVTPEQKSSVRALLDKSDHIVGYEFITADRQTVCTLSRDDESYTCEGTDLRR